ncbi:MAG: hypothetical protein HY877_08215 [Deltaproteobacteria bacterium]|nr:hypothetical protein [Deltaproteobacteria bacterium]
MIEAKTNESDLSPALLHYQEKLNIRVAIQILHKSGVKKKILKNNKIQWVISADQLLGLLP